jgi:hypothetical protein
MQLLDNIRKTVTDFRQLIGALTTAIDKNTLATADVYKTAEQILKQQEEIRHAVVFLARCEKHRRQEAGQRVGFGDANV